MLRASHPRTFPTHFHFHFCSWTRASVTIFSALLLQRRTCIYPLSTAHCHIPEPSISSLTANKLPSRLWSEKSEKSKIDPTLPNLWTYWGDFWLVKETGETENRNALNIETRPLNLDFQGYCCKKIVCIREVILCLHENCFFATYAFLFTY